MHGSKTGLVLPALSDIEALQDRFGDAVTFVVDACQARITSPAIHDYLKRGCLVLMTGSKFIGAPPFNGWALIPPAFASTRTALPEGFAQIFRRAEWPQDWPGRDALQDSANPSLVLRLEAAVFELERFQAIAMSKIEALIDAFEEAIEDHVFAVLPVRRVTPGSVNSASAARQPIEMRTLITLDISDLPGMESFEQAQELHRALALDGVRLGQPVKCVRGRDQAGWGGTVRVGLSMPQMIRWAAGPLAQARAEMASDMQRIAQAIENYVKAPPG